jgi:putative spermidine/putrescine transport system permease protein
LLVVPALAFLLVFFVYPLTGLLLRSFSPSGALSFWPLELGLVNYVSTVRNVAYQLILRETLLVSVLSTPIAVAVAYPIAYALTRIPRHWAVLGLGVVALPYFVPILVRLYALTQVLEPLHLLYTTTGTVVGLVYWMLPYMIVILYAAMIAVDGNLLLASRSLGAGPRQAFTRIFFPLTRPALVAGALVLFVFALGTYVTPAVVGNAANLTVAVYIEQVLTMNKWGVGSAMGMILLAITLLVYGFSSKYLYTMGSPPAASSQKGASRAQRTTWTPTLVISSLWAVLGFLFLFGPLLISVLVSFTSTTFLSFPPTQPSLRWYEKVAKDPGWLTSGWLSVQVAFVTMITATGLALGAAYALERSKIRGKAALRALFICPIIVPVVLIGGALYDLESQLRLTQTFAGYVIGHTIVAFPFPFILISTALQGTDPSLEAAARTLGAGPWTAFRRVVLPVIVPAMAAAGLFSFITSFDEAVITLYLTGPDMTLPVKMLIFLMQQLTPEIAAVASVLLLAMLIVYIASFALRRRPPQTAVGP